MPSVCLSLWLWSLGGLCPSVAHEHLDLLILWVSPYTSMVTKQTVNAREADRVAQQAVGWLGRSDALEYCFSNDSALWPFGPPSTQLQDLSLRHFKSSLIKGEKRAEESSSCVTDGVKGAFDHSVS